MYHFSPKQHAEKKQNAKGGGMVVTVGGREDQVRCGQGP